MKEFNNIPVPFSLAAKDGEKSRIISGTIDLIFKEKDGWVIADYKTDKVDGNLEALVAFINPRWRCTEGSGKRYRARRSRKQDYISPI